MMTTQRLSADVLHIHHGQSVDLGLLSPITEPIFPRQEFRFGGPAAPIKRMALALIDDARTTARFRTRLRETCWWFFYETSERPMSFAWCATVLGLDVEYVRRGIRDEVRKLFGSVPSAEECMAAADAEVRNRYATPYVTPRKRRPRRRPLPDVLPPPISGRERKDHGYGRNRCPRGHRRPQGERCRECLRIALERWKRKQLGRSSAPESVGHDPCHPLRAGNGRAVEGRSTS